jgi:methylglyoxal synthase
MMSDKIDLIPEEVTQAGNLEVTPGLVQEGPLRKRIALVAHDNKKQDLLEWACYNRELLVKHDLYATGTTGSLLSEELDAPVICLNSGPLGGDQQIGARIAEGMIDLLIFFWDPLSPQPHDPDVKALLRIAVVWNIPVACDRATADYVISSPLMTGEYERQLPDYDAYISRFQVQPATLPQLIVTD